MFKRIKENKWLIISVVLVVLIVTGYLYQDAWVTKVINDSNEEAEKKQEIIDGLEIEKNDILSERKDYQKRYEYLRENPVEKLVKVIKYKTINNIEYVESSKYTEAWNAWEDCDRKFRLCMDNFDSMDINYNHYIDNCQKQKKELTKQVDIFRDARDKIARRQKKIYSAMTISLLTFDAGMYHGEENMQYYQNIGMETHPNHPIKTKAIQFDTKFYFIKISISLLKKDIFRKNWF